MDNNEKTSFKNIMSKVYQIISPYKNSYILIVLFCILSAIFSSLAPYFLGYATDSLYDSFTSSMPYQYKYIIKVLIIVAFCYIMDALSTYIKNYLSSKVGQIVGYNLRNSLIDKINKIKLKKIDTLKKGDIISKITNDVERLCDNITEVVPELVYNFTLIIGVVIMMFILDFTLALITIVAVPITFIILSKVIKRSQKYFELNQSSIGNVNAFVEECVTNNDVIKSFNKEEYYNKV